MEIHNDTEYQAALKEFDGYLSKQLYPETLRSERFIELGNAIERYESKDWLSFPGPNLPDW